MALDFGTKRIGVALSDATGSVAMPFGFLPAEPRAELLRSLQQLIERRQVGLIVVGMPRNMDGSYGPAAEQVKQFVAWLRGSVEVPVETWDERLTTVQANRLFDEAEISNRKRRHKVDQVAAALLLQSFLDYQRLRRMEDPHMPVDNGL